MAEPTAPAPGGADTSPFGIKGKLNDRVSGKNWTWPLRIGCILVGLGFIVAGFFGIFTISINPLKMLGTIISAIYVMYAAPATLNLQNSLLDFVLLGALLIVAIIPFPPGWHAASLKWFGLLHKYRGRGFYLIFVGVLAFGCGIAGYIVGAVAILLGIFHFVLAIWFKDTLDKKAPMPHEMTPEQQEAQRKKDVKGVALDAIF